MRSAGLKLLIALVCAVSASFPTPVVAAEGSRCVALAQAPVGFGARIVPVALPADTVSITYVTHATFRIRSPGGLTIATDFAGFAGAGGLPDVVTMNHAHETHYTDFPDPEIAHVLRGWNPAGGPARHRLKLKDVLIRNVPTDIRRWGGGREKDGNSIFIFEVADLCIGHLGHLHHELAPEDLAHIGQLDIVFAPVDGTMTLDHERMARTLKVLKASVNIPMHAFSNASLQSFILHMGKDFPVRYAESETVRFSAADLPKKQTILIVPEFSGGWDWDR